MPSKAAAQLQHSCEFVEKEDAAVMRKAPVAKGDSYISRRTTHSDFNITKNDVKVRTENRRESPAKSGQKPLSLRVFTPDSGNRDERPDKPVRKRESWRLAPVQVADVFLAEQHHAQPVNAQAHTAGWGNALLDS